MDPAFYDMARMIVLGASAYLLMGITLGGAAIPLRMVFWSVRRIGRR